MGATETQLAKFVREYPAGQIPEDITHLAKRCVMNYCGVALYGSLDPSVEILLDLFRSDGATAAATVLGKGFRTSPQNAALANGYIGHLEDYDDTHTTVIHPTSPIFPAPLAISEQQTTSGRDLLAAFTIGVEVACRLGLLITQHFRDGADFWHITNTCGVIGAAAAAGRLLGLTEEQMVWAFAVAGTQASGVREVFGSMCKPFHAGRAAQNGLVSATLVKHGFTGVDNIFTGNRGFTGVMAKDYDLGELTAGLGDHWELPNVGLKPYSCGAANHAFLDAAIALRTRDGVRPDTVKRIEGRVPRFAPNLIRHRHPEVALDTKFSYYHGIAVGLVDGQALPAQFTDAKAHDPVIHGVRDKVEVAEDPSLGEGAVITLTLTDSREYVERVEHASGTPGNPLSDAQVESKFKGLAAEVLPHDQVDRAADMLWNLEKVSDARELIRLLVPS
jgi:2-methylcitrate dehydratase PrpD